jgi:hypothetical protein
MDAADHAGASDVRDLVFVIVRGRRTVVKRETSLDVGTVRAAAGTENSTAVMKGVAVPADKENKA